MSAKISDLQERQIVNIADGKCLGNIKDIELNMRLGVIQALVLPGIGGFRGFLQNPNNTERMVGRPSCEATTANVSSGFATEIPFLAV